MYEALALTVLFGFLLHPHGRDDDAEGGHSLVAETLDARRVAFHLGGRSPQGTATHHA